MASQNSLLELARTDLLAFIVYMMPTYEVAPHHRLLCKKVQEVINTPDARLMVSIPPRHGKSTIISEFLPAFLFGVSTRERVITASHTAKLATFFGKKIRRMINSRAYKALFPHVSIIGDGESGAFYELEGGSQYMAIGRDGGVSGFDSTFTIVDDLINSSKEAKSPTVLSSLHEWWDSTMGTRTMPGGRIIIVSTRWSKNDLQGYLLDKEPDTWEFFNIPALCEDPETDLLGRKEGEALWPSWYSREYLMKAKKKNAYQFSALYQGNPVAKEGNTFPVSSIQFEQSPDKYDCKVLSYDTASTVNDDSCNSASVMLKISGNKAWVSQIMADKLEFPQLVKEVLSDVNKYEPDWLLIEEASSGIQLIQLLRDNKIISPKLVPTSGKASKDQKIENLLWALDNGHLMFEEGCDDLIEEMKSYPYGVTDDLVISLAHAVNWWFEVTNSLTKKVPVPGKVNLDLNRFLTKKRVNRHYGELRNLFTKSAFRKNYAKPEKSPSSEIW